MPLLEAVARRALFGASGPPLFLFTLALLVALPIYIPMSKGMTRSAILHFIVLATTVVAVFFLTLLGFAFTQVGGSEALNRAFLAACAVGIVLVLALIARSYRMPPIGWLGARQEVSAVRGDANDH